MALDEYLEMAEDQLDQAAQEWNVTGEVLEPAARVGLAQVYALTSIARALHLLAVKATAPGPAAPYEKYDPSHPYEASEIP